MSLKNFIFIFIGLLTSTSRAEYISDSLVENLPCKNLSVQEIYRKIRPDAFSSQFHIPLTNWSFSYLAGCWSLSRTQRIMFMLSRNEPNTLLSQEETRDILDLFRGSSPYFLPNESGEYQVQEWFLRDYQVYPMDNTVLSRSEIWRSLVHGWTEKMWNASLIRGFKNEIEVFQWRRFHDPGNLEMGLGSWARLPAENFKTWQILVKNLNEKKLTLINLRADQTVQHVVVVKRFEITHNGEYVFYAYDSNFPRSDRTFIYNPQEAQFYAHQILGPFYGTTYLPRAVGAFIVDEKERDKIDAALLRHYRQLCQ